MPYGYKNSKGQTYYLHARSVARSGGKAGKLFYFSPQVEAGDALEAVPAGYQVIEMKTGLPVLKKV